jgi:hypothetical protein
MLKAKETQKLECHYLISETNKEEILHSHTSVFENEKQKARVYWQSEIIHLIKIQT